eukprot:6873213-Heterocapsa_arctica.AAC.1
MLLLLLLLLLRLLLRTGRAACQPAFLRRSMVRLPIADRRVMGPTVGGPGPGPSSPSQVSS